MNTRPRHVLVVPSWFPTSRAPHRGRFALEQARALRDHRGWRVGIIAPQLVLWRYRPFAQLRETMAGIRKVEDRGIPAVVQTVGAPPIHSLRSGMVASAAERLYQCYVREFGVPDLLHAHTCIWGGVAASILARRHRIPMVLTEHWSMVHRGLLGGHLRKAAIEVYRSAIALAAVSDSLAGRVRELAGGRPVAVIPNVIDTDFFTPGGTRERGRLVAIGNLVGVKGFDILLRAFALLPGQRARLVIGGDGPERVSLEALARSLGVSDRVQWLGVLDQAQTREEMRRAELLVSGSRSETFGIVFLEGVATGLRYVAVDSGGPRGFTAPELGTLVPPDSPEALSRAIAEALSGSAASPADRLHALVAARFGPAVAAQRLEDFYLSALQ